MESAEHMFSPPVFFAVEEGKKTKSVINLIGMTALKNDCCLTLIASIEVVCASVNQVRRYFSLPTVKCNPGGYRIKGVKKKHAVCRSLVAMTPLLCSVLTSFTRHFFLNGYNNYPCAQHIYF